MAVNALTVDLEDWYHTSALNIDISQWNGCEQRIEASTRRLLGLLDAHGTKATFFVLGCVAEKYPDLVGEIAGRGHEIGSHGGWHRMLTGMSPEQFRADLRFSRAMLEAASGQPVRLFRAPSWSISPDNYGLLRILQEEGFTCDSSIQPFATPLSGISGAPQLPFYPMLAGEKLELLEFPSSVLRLGKLSLPFSGGFYLRALPYACIAWALRSMNKRGPGMIYLHPWELDTGFPRTKAPFTARLVQHYNLHTTEKKLDKLLEQFAFAPLGEVIRAHTFPVQALQPR